MPVIRRKSGYPGGPEGVGSWCELGDQGAGRLSGIAGQGIGGMGADPIAQKVASRLVGGISVVPEDRKRVGKLNPVGIPAQQLFATTLTSATG